MYSHWKKDSDFYTSLEHVQRNKRKQDKPDLFAMKVQGRRGNIKQYTNYTKFLSRYVYGGF